MVPHHIQRDRRNAARFGAKPRFGFRHFRQIIRQHVDAAVHKNPVDNLRGIVLAGLPRTKSASKLPERELSAR
jgi:hypothetical protein